MLTVGDVLDAPTLRVLPVHVPVPEAVVRWVATSELADPGPFLEGAEILLSTGVNSAGWDWSGYVARLRSAGVAALGFATELSYDQVPGVLVAACRDQGLNLFEVPRATTFVAISRETARLLDERVEATAREALDMQRALTRAALVRDTSRLLNRLAHLVGGWAGLVGTDGRLAIVEGAVPSEADDVMVREEVARLRPHGLKASRSATVGGNTLVLQPVGLGGRPESWLVVSRRGRFDDAARIAVTTAVALLSLAAEDAKERRSTARGLVRRVLELLLRGDERSARLLLAAVSGEDVDEVFLPSRVIALRAAGPADALDDAHTAVEDLAREVLAARVEDELWAVVPPDVEAEACGLMAGHGLRVGSGEAVTPAGLAHGHETAGLALGQASNAAPVRHWRDIVGSGPLALLDPPAALAFSRSFLAPLAEQRTDREQLLRLLSSFVRHNGSRGDVAAELGVHRNTVRHRVTETEHALGRSLDDPAIRVSAWLALQIETTLVPRERGG